MIIPDSDSKAIALAVETLLRHELVAIPTETVYGLAGLSTSADAIARIYAAKKRPAHNPLISHISGISMAEHYVQFDPLSLRLAEIFWPGPLTLILPLRDGGIHRSSTAGQNLVAIRAPQGFGHRLIEELGQPVAAPSANSSGRISPTQAAHVAADLGPRVPLIIDGGPTRLGVESTVLRADASGVRILRPGALTVENIVQAIDVDILKADNHEIGLSPGTMSSHYAPRAAVRPEARQIRQGEAVLDFAGSRPDGIEGATAVYDLSPTGDLAEAAQRLFDLLHQADASGTDSIAVVPIPRNGLGIVINDRLERASASRD